MKIQKRTLYETFLRSFSSPCSLNIQMETDAMDEDAVAFKQKKYHEKKPS